jgi:hypothetical protein
MSHFQDTSTVNVEVTKETDHASQPNMDSRWPRMRRYLTVLVVGVLALTGVGIIRLAADLSTQATIGPQSDLASVVHTYLSAMANNDAEGAYDLFSTRSQQQVKLADVKKLLRGEGQIVFQGYQGSHVNHTDIRVLLSTDPTLPRGLTARLLGTTTYENDLQGSFEAILELDGSQWQLHSIRVTGPPERNNLGPQAREQPIGLVSL